MKYYFDPKSGLETRTQDFLIFFGTSEIQNVSLNAYTKIPLCSGSTLVVICSMPWVGVEVSPFLSLSLNSVNKSMCLYPWHILYFLLGYVIGRQLATVVCLAVCWFNPLHFHQDLILATSIHKGVGSLSRVKSICYEVVILV